MTSRGGFGPCDGGASGFRPAVRRRTFFSAMTLSCFFRLLYFFYLHDTIVADSYPEGHGFRHTERIKKLDAVLHSLCNERMACDFRDNAPLHFNTATFSFRFQLCKF